MKIQWHCRSLIEITDAKYKKEMDTATTTTSFYKNDHFKLNFVKCHWGIADVYSWMEYYLIFNKLLYILLLLY